MPTLPPLITLKDARLGFGGRPLFDGLDIALSSGDRVALVGRNGSGKSTLLRVLAGKAELDAGERMLRAGAQAGYLPQDPVLPHETTVAAFVGGDLPVDAQHRAAAVMDRLALDGDRLLGTLSGGEGRRAALARALLGRPEVLLLDEPTNHLDLPTIQWLEGELQRHDGALMVVSHDRAFLRAVSRAVVWLDRGRAHRLERNFADFDEWAEEVRDAEAREVERLGKRIEREEHWLHRGVTARRKRNQRRVQRLQELRQSRARMLAGQPGEVKMSAAEAGRSGKLVIEAEHLAKAYASEDGGERRIVEDFSTRIARGERVGVIGPNGAGKTTLVRLLLGLEAPDSGTLRLGSNLEVAYFDQRREALDPELTLWKTLAPDSDSVMVQGRPRHVVAYLRDFLFEEAQARQPVKSLSGGEKNRLLLARLFARPSNLLVMDEPTNDLDMDTLDLLVEVLNDYEGTLILVSHDRDFLDRLATSVIAVEGGGRVVEFAGGYTDAIRQRGAPLGSPAGPAGTKEDKAKSKPAKRGKTASHGQKQQKLGYKEQRELDKLPAEIARLGGEIEALERKLADPEFYNRDPDGFHAATEELNSARAALDAAETRWLELEERRESLAVGGGA
ncbi:MAG: ATP-binding cassette domain-containing protein [Rhodovibrionaceae bacterium]|nr:ATP-binding cassette domain-containing protein [Rhodovibrionaceae bacterium]